MKIKKVLLVLIVAICTVIGCTSCGAKKIGSTTETTPTVVVTRPDYSGEIKIKIIGVISTNLEEINNQANEWLMDNRDKTIISIEFQIGAMYSTNAYSTVTIIYRDNGTTPPQQ